MYKPLVLMLSIFCAANAMAQTGYFNNHTEKDGLSNNKIKCITQDSKGFLWIGTNYGLNKFDGSSFEKFTINRNNPNSIANSNIHDIITDKRGNVWIATETNGVDMYDEGHKKFVHYIHNNSGNSIAENEIMALFADSKGNIWIGYVNKGWSKYNPVTKQFSHYKANYTFINAWGRNASNSITAFAEDKRGNIWIASGFGLHCQKADNSIATIIDSLSPTQYEARNLYLCAYNFSDSIVMLGTWAGGLKAYNTYTQQFTTYLQQPNPLNIGNKNIFKKIARKNSKELYLATLDKGLTKFNYSTKQFTFFSNEVTNPHSILPNECRTVFTDKDGVLWAGFDYGISQMVPLYQNIKVYETPPSTTKEIPASSILVLYHHTQNNTLYFALEGGKGLYQQDGITKKLELLPTKGLQFSFTHNNYINAICYWNDEELLVNIDGKYYLYNIPAKNFAALNLTYAGKTIIPSGYPSQSLNNEIWLLCFDKTYYKIKPGNNRIVQIGGVFANKEFPLAKGSIILANYTDSLAWVFNRQANELALLNTYTNQYITDYYDASNGKIIGAAKRIIRDKQGCYWVTTFNDGLYKLWKEKHNDKFNFKQYTDKDGLPDMFLDEIFCDNNGMVWIASRNGVIYFNPLKAGFNLLNDANGLPEKCYQIYSADITESGIFYAGGFKHFFELNTNLYKESKKQTTIYFKSFSVLNKPWANDTSDINNTQQIRLNYKENFFSCEVGAIHFTNTGNLSYEYKLDRLDKDWIQAGRRSFISYSNIGPGTYTLLIRLINEPSNTLKLTIIITPPFWQTWWFYCLVALVVTIAVVGFYKIRIGIVKKEEAIKTSFNKRMAEVEMKALRAQMNPHFIFNSLNSINKYILKNDSEKASAYLTKFAKLIRLILDNSEQNTVSLESELQLIKLYVEIEMLRFNNLFSYSIVVGEELKTDNIQIPPMLIQPYIENAIWHGLLHKETTGHLTIAIHPKQKNILKIIVEDDGIGRVKAAELKSKSALHKKSYGTKITDDRIQLANAEMGINAGVEILDLYNGNNEAKGTRVVLELGINQNT